MTPLPAARVLDQFFLDTRCRILDVAASLDRLDRGGPSPDPRVEQFRRALQTLLEPGPGRAVGPAVGGRGRRPPTNLARGAPPTNPRPPPPATPP